MFTRFLLSCLVLAICFTACEQKEHTAPKKDILPASFMSIRQKDISAKRLDRIILSLDTNVMEQPDFWIGIINDTGYSEFHRSLCTIGLFKRHFKTGTLLKDLPAVFKGKNKPAIFMEEFTLKRKVIRGGDWKNISYYLGMSNRDSENLLALKEKVMHEKGKVFYIELMYDYINVDLSAHPYSITGIYIGLSGDITEDQLKDHLFNGSNDSIQNTRSLGVVELMYNLIPDRTDTTGL